MPILPIHPGSSIKGVQGVQGFQGPWAVDVAQAEVEKLELKTGDILLIYYPEYYTKVATQTLVQSFQRINQRLKDKGIELADICFFQNGVRISVLSSRNENGDKPEEFRRIELSDEKDSEK